MNILTRSFLFEKEKADAGLFMSDFACQNIIDQCNAFIADSDNHYLIETFNTRIDKLTGLTQSEKRPLQTAERKKYSTNIFFQPTKISLLPR